MEGLLLLRPLAGQSCMSRMSYWQRRIQTYQWVRTTFPFRKVQLQVVSSFSLLWEYEILEHTGLNMWKKWKMPSFLLTALKCSETNLNLQKCEFKIKNFTGSISPGFIRASIFNGPTHTHTYIFCVSSSGPCVSRRPPAIGRKSSAHNIHAHTHTHDAWAARRQPKTTCQNKEGLSLFSLAHCVAFEVRIIVIRLKSRVHKSQALHQWILNMASQLGG